jgi:hypothetical protein
VSVSDQDGPRGGDRAGVAASQLEPYDTDEVFLRDIQLLLPTLGAQSRLSDNNRISQNEIVI